MKVYDDGIPEYLIGWIQKQHVFWVASAPLSAEGRVNVSAKGLEGTFHIVDSKKVWYEDMAGSGSETMSHVRENGRITILFSAFEGPPRMARLHGKGTVYEYGTPGYNELLSPSDRHPGSRSIIVVDVERVSTSCGYTVPYYEFRGHRYATYYKIAEKLEGCDLASQDEIDGSMSEKGLRTYLMNVNAKSIDGLPAVTVAHEAPRSTFSAIIGKARKKDGAWKAKADTPSPSESGKAKVSAVLQIADLRFLLGIFMGLLLANLYSRVGASLVFLKAK
ncbi:hypothetical protein GYMLUDRAFT_60494 [Collybiopsis luxurians FD-317 M1]|uniref:Pyridoxamine 5'-phosphate oxidase N-terminal domain-containing protein n=1 Tax=Collybiopsis luxurians FD-317 M1 TaxID=944289 RepID=A0A0D0CSN2_9AGAR|nr:hypothetical protein GYMLUDRAFT_60494 [Collybiopsis luxurians FD-317 M1]